MKSAPSSGEATRRTGPTGRGGAVSEWQPQSPPRRVLVVKPSSLGDVVHTLPAVATLRRQWPHARIEWLVNPEWAPVVRGSPAVDAVWEFPRADFRGFFGPARLLRWAADFGSRHPADLVLDFQGLFRSAFIGKCARGGVFWGISDAREGARFFYDRVARVDPGAHAVDRYLALAGALGARLPCPENLEWAFPSSEVPRARSGFFSQDSPFVAVHPFSRGRGKSMTRSEVIALCEAMAPVRVVLLGRSGEVLPGMGHVENLLNETTLLELLAVLRCAAWTISVDSGPMHMAAALSPRVVAIHTWSDPDRVGPYPESAWVLKEGRLATRANWREGGGISMGGMGALADWVKARL